jgi:hypothetical protein
LPPPTRAQIAVAAHVRKRTITRLRKLQIQTQTETMNMIDHILVDKDKGVALSVDYDRGVITVNDVDYAFDFFTALGGKAAVGMKFEVVKREDRAVTLRRTAFVAKPSESYSVNCSACIKTRQHFFQRFEDAVFDLELLMTKAFEIGELPFCRPQGLTARQIAGSARRASVRSLSACREATFMKSD